MFTLGRINEDRSGEILGAGVASGARSLADAIQNYGAMRDEGKGYLTLLKAMSKDPNSGIDPEAVDKMSWDDAKGAVLATEFKRNLAKEQQQQQEQDKSRFALGNLLRSFAGGMPNTPDLAGTLALGQGPLANPISTPDILKRTILAAANDPSVMNTPMGARFVGGSLEAAIQQAAGGGEDNTPLIGELPTGEKYLYQPRTKNSPLFPPSVRSEARLTEIEATTKAAAERDAARAEQRTKDRATLTPKDLLASYQADLKSLENPMNWGDSTAEDRAVLRAKLTAAIAAVREPGGAEAGTGQPKPSATGSNTITTKGGFKITF